MAENYLSIINVLIFLYYNGAILTKIAALKYLFIALKLTEVFLYEMMQHGLIRKFIDIELSSKSIEIILILLKMI